MSTFEFTNMSSFGDEYTISCYVGFNTTFRISFLPLELNHHILLCLFHDSRFWSRPLTNSMFMLEGNSDEFCKVLVGRALSNDIKVQIQSDKFKLISIKLVDVSRGIEVNYEMNNEESVNELKLSLHNLELRLTNKLYTLEKKLDRISNQLSIEGNELKCNDEENNYMQVEKGEVNERNDDVAIDINCDDEPAVVEHPQYNPCAENVPLLHPKANLRFQIIKPSFTEEKKTEVFKQGQNQAPISIEKNRKGEKWLEQNNAERALYYFEQAIIINPDFQQAYINKADALDILGKYKKALMTIEEALKISNDSSAAHNVKGAILRNLEMYEEALKCFNTAIELNKSDIGYHINKVNCLYDLERFEDCIGYSIYALTMFADLKNADKANLYKPMIEKSYESKNFEESFQYCENALEINPDDEDLLRYYDILYYELHTRK